MFWMHMSCLQNPNYNHLEVTAEHYAQIITRNISKSIKKPEGCNLQIKRFNSKPPADL